jgi:hypothetical protein
VELAESNDIASEKSDEDMTEEHGEDEMSENDS